MDNRNTNKHKSIIKTIFFIIILIIIVFLFLRGCNKNIINDGIKIVDIKQSVDSFNNDTIFLNENLNKDKRYSYDITIHNYLDEDYYLYKVEIDNNFISYDKLLKLLKSNKDTKFRFNITPKKKINKKVKIKFYYGKLKEIKIGEDIVTFFGDEKVQLPLGEVKEGYRFLGYTDVEGSTKVKYEENKKYDIKDGTTLYPIYKEDKTASNPNTGTNSTSNNNNNTSEQPKENKKYIVTFDYQNGKEKTTKEVTYNEKYGTLPTAIKNGYAFTGWYLDDTKITSDSIVTITKDEILKAKYIIINYGISYDLQGGTVSSNPDSYTTESNDITLLNPSKSGYVFVGWTGSNGTTPEKNVVIKKGSTGSKNYKANFSANEIVNYKVIHKKEKLDGSFDIEEEVFSAPYGSKVKPEVRSYEGFTSPSKKELIVKEDGTSEIEYEYMRNKYTFTLGDNENVISSHTSGEYPYETSITLTAKEKNGYTFKKWSDGQTENPITFLLTEDISISPIYEANKYIVVFDSNTGIGTMPAQEMTYDQVQRLNLNAFTKVGNRFVGWNTKANGEGTAYLDGELVKNLVTEGSITLYAQYILEQYTISFDTDGGDELFNTTRTYGETYGTLPEAQKTGYTFIGWYLGDNKIESSTVVDITENITLKARYTIKNYNISYDLKDGSVSTANPQTYTVEDEFTLNNPSKQGYEFAGWTGTGLEGLTTSVKINKGTTEDLSFAANYTAGTATPYKVIHKYQNYNLTTYTEEEQSLTGVTGTTVYPQIRHKDGFIDPEVTSVQIKADGTTRLEYTYQRDSYTYSFDSNVTSSKEAGTYLYETEITVTPKEKAGYTFKEWEDVTTSNPRTITLSSNTSVVPIYEANKYNVIFNSNTGTGSMPAQEMTYDAESNLIKNTFAKVGYTFVGWNTEDDGEGTPYSDEASVKNLAESGNVILYAQWIANTNTPYKVIHKYQNLDLETYTEEVENKTGTTDAQVTPSVQSKTGFVNPSTQTVTINGNGLTEIIYTYNRETHTYALGNTTNVTSSLPTGNYPYGTEITITANEVPGYTFDKWSDNNTDNPREITLTDDITLSPIYTANTDTTYKVIHRYQNLDSTTYTEEVENKTGTTDTQVTPSVKSKTGFVNPSTQTVIINGNGLTEVIYNYTRETYTFTLEDTENVTSSVPAGNYPYGTEITLTANEIPGYTFDKWNDECTDNPRTITLVGNTTLKPTYTANTNTSYTVHHNKQNITLGGYVLSETDNLTGTTDTKVTPNVKDYEGFTAPVPTEVTIKGDGTTVVEYNYTRNEYTFTLNGAEDVVSTLPSGNYPYETSITLTAQAKVGYNFAGWSDGCEDNPRTISLVGNVELSPVYTNRTDTTYTVIYETMNLDGETYSEYRKDVLTGETGSKVTPEVITITGFTKPTAQEITIKADGTASLEYKYTRNKYSFAYSDTDDIDLDNSTPAGNYYYETEITVKAKEKEGYAFKDWSNGDSVNPTTFILDDAKTISAYYEANKYNVVFNANTGTGSMEEQEMTYDTESNLTKNTFIKEGYTFAGWNTDPYGEGTSYEDEAPVENLATSGNIILYAQWVEYPEANYTVYHYKQNLELDDYDLEYEEELSGITNAEVTPEVYDYEGFNSPETQTVTIAADGSTEVYYYYTRKMYTFEIENSEFISSSHENGEYPYETEIEIYADEIPRYTFMRWSDGNTDNPRMITLDEDMNISAEYHLTEPYEVTFDSNGGEGDMDSLIYERDTTYNLPSNEFTNSGYIFAGWNTESDGTGIDYYDGESVINITEEDSVTLYALWAEEQYVAQIGNDYYTTLQKAIDAVPTTKVETTVKLLKDTSETITIANTKNVVLNLQNLTLSNSGDTNVIINNGILKIYNGNITSDASQGVINNNSGATLVMSGGRIIMTGNKQGIYNDGGTLTISGTAYIRSDSNQRAVIHNKSNGTVNITGGEIVSTQHYAIYNENGTMNIGTKDGIINNETPIIQGKTYGIVANSSYNFYDGIIKGITNPVGKTSNTGNTPTVSLDTNETKINELENNSAKIHGTEEIDSLTYKTLSLNKDSTTYKITFDANGGNSSVSEKTVIITESIGELPTPTREGYTFIGWFENLLTGVKIESSYIPTSDMTLIAKYYKSIENATITPSKIIIDVGEEETINVTNIEEEYSFRSINPEVATVDQSGKVTGVSKGTTTIEITGSTSGKTATISVKVLQNHYTISFETDGGTPVEDIRIEQGESIGNLPETKKKGYTFDGWYKESTYNTKIDSSYTPTEDTRLYALWIMNPYPTFKTGSYINAKMKQLAGQSDADYSTSNSSITSILRSETKPNDSVLIDDNIVSTDDSIIPIYMWYEDNTIYYYSDAITIYLNPDSSHMFQYVTRLTNLDSSSWDTSKVTDMSWMFCECQFSRSLDLSNFDTRNVTDMRGIFSDCWYLQSLNISTWNTSKVTNMLKMFWNCSHIKSLDLSSFDTRNVTEMSGMFASCNELTYLNLSSFDTRNVTRMYNMFIYCNKLTILDLSSFDTSNVEDMGNMFYSCKELTTIYASDKFVTDKVYSENVMFGIANKIVGGAGTTYNPSKIGTEYARIDDPDNGKPGYFTSKNKKYTMFKDGNTVNNKMKQLAGTTNTNADSKIVSILRTETKPDDSILIDDNKVSIEGSAYPIYMWYDNRTIYYYSEAETLYLNQDSSYMFYFLSSLTTIDISNLDTSKVINMSDMFSCCESLTTLDLSSFDTSNVTNMSYMFQASTLLRNLNLSNFDTSKVESMTSMFKNCESLTTLDLSSFDTRNVTNMYNMFNYAVNLKTIYVSDKFVTNIVSNSGYMFYKNTRLVGGSGTAFDDTKTDKEYARIDDPANGNPGYFTEKIANNSNSLSENSSPKRGVVESNINSSESVIKTITFNSNGGIGDMVTQEFDINSDIVININTFTNTGEYEFIGWNTEPDGTGIGYTDGDTILSNTYNDNIILYAQWQIDGWVLINKEYIDTISLEEQEWAYYNHGVRIENGFHVLPDLSGTDKLYNISNGIAQLGWIEDQDNNWFYFSKLDTNGDGYIDLDAYVDGDYIIDEITYRFDENGICLNHDGSSLSASVSTFTNNNFKIPLEAYSLRRYFMGIVY